ncbi:MAG: BrnA antitoxin family protein [Pseudooceanicola sp.]
MAYRMTKSERIRRRAWARDETYLEAIQLDVDIRERFPLEWKLLAHDLDVTEKKEKVTLYVDRSVARMYRGLGNGYQGVMNRVLRVWMQAKTADWLEMEAKILELERDLVTKKSMRSGVPLRERPGFDESVADWPEAEMPGESDG